MQNERSPLLIYRQKTAEIHSPEEIKAAFDESFAVCFAFDREKSAGRDPKPTLFTSIWDCNPDAIITETDLCVIGKDSLATSKQILLVNKNGTKESANEIVKLIEESGAVSAAYCFFSQRKAGIKGCYRRTLGSDQSTVVKKANLLIDGQNLIITVRHISRTDHAKMKDEENKQ